MAVQVKYGQGKNRKTAWQDSKGIYAAEMVAESDIYEWFWKVLDQTKKRKIFLKFLLNIFRTLEKGTQSAGTVKFTDCISSED